MRDPPRRLDANLDRDNPDTFNICVYLDGDKVKDCTAYDLDEGWIEQIALDEKGKPIIFKDEFKIVRKTGRILIAWIHPERVV